MVSRGGQRGWSVGVLMEASKGGEWGGGVGYGVSEGGGRGC